MKNRKQSISSSVFIEMLNKIECRKWSSLLFPNLGRRCNTLRCRLLMHYGVKYREHHPDSQYGFRCMFRQYKDFIKDLGKDQLDS